MRVFVAGATGVVGRRLVALLAGRGHEVVGTTRSPGRTDAIRLAGAEPVVLDGLDAVAVGEAVAKARPDVVVHEMTALQGIADLRRFDRTFAGTNALRTAGVDNLLAAATAAGVRRAVVQSFTGWTNPPGDGLATEEEPLTEHVPPAQRESLAAIRHLERAVTSADLEGTVLRYGLLYGPGASDAMVEAVRGRRFPLVGDAAGVWSFLHADDAASATVAAVEGDATGLFNVVDDEPAPVAEWLPYLAECTGAKPPRRVPAALARLLAGEAAVAMSTTQRGASNARARRELGWAPRWSTWRDGFRTLA
ncbi:MAG TPA: NAD(P)-dependent oxidoreductase [Mycobacteriales bacterium]